MKKMDWMRICELIADLCIGMALGMEICVNKFSIDKIGNGFYSIFETSMCAVAATANLIQHRLKKN